LGDGGGAFEPWLALVGNACQQLLDLSDGLAGVEALGAGLGAVHDGVTPVHRERISQLVQSVAGVLVSAVDDPAVSLHENGWPKVSVSVPPVGGTRGGAAGAQDALVEAVKLGPVLHGLEVLLGAMGPGGVVVAL